MSLSSPHPGGRGRHGCHGCLRPRASWRGSHSAAGPGRDPAGLLPGAAMRRTCPGARVAEVDPAVPLRDLPPPPAHRAPVLMLQVLFRAQDADPEPRSHVVRGNQSQSALLAGLRKFVLYELQVQAFTRIGAGVPSSPPALARTQDDGACAQLGPQTISFFLFQFGKTKQNCLQSLRV